MGIALLDRDCRPVRLTEAGRLFYEHATQVLERIDDLRTMMRRFRDAERPRFVIGFVASTIYAALPNNLIRRCQSGGDRVGRPHTSTIRRCGRAGRSGLWSPYP